jgi:endogenous inhibitor of DNA gyrase (YacG/DUF329 family)
MNHDQNPKKQKTRLIKCPSCRKLIEYDLNNPWRPFCSERCKTIDIAAWANEEYRVAGDPISPETRPAGEDDEEQ